MTGEVRNLYVHFPFCRRKCSYCALHSGVGSSPARRDAYARDLAGRLQNEAKRLGCRFSTVYFGGGSPALCDLSPVFSSLAPFLTSAFEFTVELHPLDVTDELLTRLRDSGVNRLSMGVQSLDDATLADMGRGYTASEAFDAFRRIRRHFDNAGIDLIAGYPALRPETPRQRGQTPRQEAPPLAEWGLAHCSLYSLILEEKSLLSHRLRQGAKDLVMKSDDETLDERDAVGRELTSIGLERYEISNYARPGFKCQHNLAVWRGEDYLGLGDGAFGRLGLHRTEMRGTSCVMTSVTEAEDAKERALFRLRTREGIDARLFPEWPAVLERFAAEGLVKRKRPDEPVFVLTPRGTEVCDSVLAELV